MAKLQHVTMLNPQQNSKPQLCAAATNKCHGYMLISEGIHSFMSFIGHCSLDGQCENTSPSQDQ